MGQCASAEAKDSEVVPGLITQTADCALAPTPEAADAPCKPTAVRSLVSVVLKHFTALVSFWRMPFNCAAVQFNCKHASEAFRHFVEVAMFWCSACCDTEAPRDGTGDGVLVLTQEVAGDPLQEHSQPALSASSSR